MNFGTFELKNKEYALITELISKRYGIDLHNGKRELIKSRLNKLLRKNGFESFEQYVKSVVSDKTGAEIEKMVDAITTNVTDFFREPDHFDFLRKKLLPELVREKKEKREDRIRIWSAGCSNGKEPYSIGISIAETVKEYSRFNIKILATDISRAALKVGTNRIYSKRDTDNLPLSIKIKYFDKLPDSDAFRIKHDIASLVYFRYLNLNGNWPIENMFDFIFCRNVMIYFDPSTQRNLFRKFGQFLRSGGYLFLGHSESLKNSVDIFKYIAPAIYRKVG